MRTKAEIIADPQATEQEILVELDPYETIAHPNCPRERWWEIAENLPVEAIRSPAYALLTLESPERWAQMETTSAHVWIVTCDDYFESEVRAELWVCDCLMHMLPLFEKVCGTQPILAEWLRVRRLYAEHKILAGLYNETMLQSLQWLMKLGTRRSVNQYDTIHFADAALKLKVPYKAVMDAIWSLTAGHAKYHVLSLWCWHRMVAYFQGDV